MNTLSFIFLRNMNTMNTMNTYTIYNNNNNNKTQCNGVSHCFSEIKRWEYIGESVHTIHSVHSTPKIAEKVFI